MHGFTGEFSDYAKLFKDGNPMYGDYWYHLEVLSYCTINIFLLPTVLFN